METIIEKLTKFIGYLEEPNPEALQMSMADVHAPGMFSLVINGTEPGKLTRVFIDQKELKPYDVQLHTHRYGLDITILKGNILHHTAVQLGDEAVLTPVLPKYNYKSFLNGGKGLTLDTPITRQIITQCNLPVGTILDLSVTDYHTMSCNIGAMWVVEEKGFELEQSQVLGVPFVVDNLYSKPKQYQINDACQMVLKELRAMLGAFQYNAK